MSRHAREIARAERFDFGKNWARFIALLDEKRIAQAAKSLAEMLETSDLNGKSFLDIGSGSGLFSLAARRLGARVHSFDYDPRSVACTKELRRLYYPDDSSWIVEEGSALDCVYMRSLGQFDVVYSWGVLHHTGQMWQALENALLPVGRDGKLFIALYNDTGSQTARWRWIKRKYNELPRPFRLPFTLVVIAPDELKAAARALLRLRPQDYIHSWTRYETNRGMNRWRDIVDWVGGYPYEVATPDQVFEFFKRRGLVLTRLKCGGTGLGCNEFVFVRNHEERGQDTRATEVRGV